MTTLNFQFDNGLPEPERQALLDNLRRAGAKHVRPLFPNEPDPALAAVYAIECEDERRFQVLLSTAYPVRFVENQVRRKQPRTKGVRRK